MAEGWSLRSAYYDTGRYRQGCELRRRLADGLLNWQFVFTWVEFGAYDIVVARFGNIRRVCKGRTHDV